MSKVKRKLQHSFNGNIQSGHSQSIKKYEKCTGRFIRSFNSFKIHISKRTKDCLIKLKEHQKEISEVSKAKYLGDILTEEGNIEDRKKKV